MKTDRIKFRAHEVSWQQDEKLGAIAAFALPFLVYVTFLCPTIAAGDSAEFVTAAKIVGIPHPPGYPLVTLIGHIFTWLPLNSVAWRVNLSSALFCAFACLFIYLALLRLTGRIWPALAGALALAFSRYFWHYAEVAEVFPLNNLFAALLTYVLVLIGGTSAKVRQVKDSKTPSQAHSQILRLFWLFSFLSGLALTNHHTIILLAPAALFYLWKSAPLLFREGKTLGLALLFFILGLSPYLYAPLAAWSQPLINWDNPVTLNRFLRLILRADYGGFSPFASASSLPRLSQLPALFVSFYHQFTAMGIGLALVGLFDIKRHKLFQGYLGVAFFFSGIFFVMYANVPFHNPLLFGVLQRFYILPAVMVSFWLGLGVAYLLDWMEEKKLPQPLRLASPVALLSVLILWQFMTNVKEADFRENYMAEDFAHNLLQSLPAHALFFVRGDVASLGVDYLQMVNGERPDVKTLDQAKLTYDWYYEQAKARFRRVALPGARYDGAKVLNKHFIQKNIGEFPVCFMDFKEESYQQAFRAVPHGLVYRILPRAQKYSAQALEEETNRLFANFRMRGHRKQYPPTSFEYELQKIYAEPFFRLGYEFEQARDMKKAEHYYKKALSMNPANYKVVKNLAVLYYYKMNRKQEAVTLFKSYLQLNPFDAEAHNIKQVIENYEKANHK